MASVAGFPVVSLAADALVGAGASDDRFVAGVADIHGGPVARGCDDLAVGEAEDEGALLVAAVELCADAGVTTERLSALEQLPGDIAENGEALLAPAITRRMIERFVQRAPAGTGRPAQLAELTERELDVLRLIARGLSNAEIATSLVLSEATIKSHVNRVLSKLDLRDRTQATVLAYETGLVEPGNAPQAKP